MSGAAQDGMPELGLSSAGRVGEFWRSRSVLVTGAGGFVGAWLALALAERGAQVVTIRRDDHLPSSFQALDLAGSILVVQGSLTDLALVERTISDYEVDFCFHLAGQAIVGLANRSPGATFDANIRGTWTVLEVCRTSPLVSGVVLASSVKASGGPVGSPKPATESQLVTSPYDTSKVCAEMIARIYQHSFGLRLAIARCANIYGGADFNFSRLVPGTVRSVLAGERPILRSDGQSERDYLMVDDAVEAYLRLGARLNDPAVAGQAFTFGSPQPTRTIDLVRTILQVAGREDLEPELQMTGPQAGAIDRQWLSSQKAEDRLGWSARVPIAEGLRRTVAWYDAYWSSGQRSVDAPVGVPR